MLAVKEYLCSLMNCIVVPRTPTLPQPRGFGCDTSTPPGAQKGRDRSQEFSGHAHNSPSSIPSQQGIFLPTFSSPVAWQVFSVLT